MPTKPGKYWTRTREGHDAGVMTVLFAKTVGGVFCPEYLNREEVKGRWGGGEILPGTVWAGWWWSEPIPEIPPFDVNDPNNVP
jgi:hypothetical protein